MNETTSVQSVPFARQAAKGSWVSAVIVFLLLAFGGRTGARAVLELVALLLIVAGFVLGVVAIFGIRKHGKKGILAPALIGIIINAVLIFIFLTNFLAARARAQRRSDIRPNNPMELTESRAGARDSVAHLERSAKIMKPVWNNLVLLLTLVSLPHAGCCGSTTNSNPTAAELLVFLGPVREATILRFNGYSRSADGQMTFRINVNDFDYSYYVRVGRQVADAKRKEKYKVSKFEYAEAHQEGSNRRIEVSRLTLVRLDDGAEIVLTYHKPYRDERLKARLRNRLTDEVITVSKGDEFKLKGEACNVVEIKEDGVRIVDFLKQEFDIIAPKKMGE